MSFAQNLSIIMRENKLTNYSLAKILGCHQTTVKNWLEGNSDPSLKYKAEIAEKFSYDADSLDGELNKIHKSIAEESTTPSSEAEKEQKNTPLFVKRDAEYLLSLLSSMPRENYLKAVEKYINDNPQQAAKMIQSALEITIESEGTE